MRKCVSLIVIMLMVLLNVICMGAKSAESSTTKLKSNVCSLNKYASRGDLVGTYYGEYYGADGYVPRYRLEFYVKNGNLKGWFDFVDMGYGNRGPVFKMTKLLLVGNKLTFTTEPKYITDGNMRDRHYFKFKGTYSNKKIKGVLTEYYKYRVNLDVEFAKE